MIAGHFGLSLVVKAKERAVPAWALLLATQWLDVIFVPLYAAGVEGLVPLAGTRGGYGEAVIHADYTHSLVGALVLSILFGAVAALAWGRRSGVVLAAMSFSHWLLDLVVHHADLPLLPGNAGHLPLLGFGVWGYPALAALLELALVVGGCWLYWRAALACSESAHSSAKRAHFAAGTALVIGILTLGLNLLGD